MIDTTNLTRPTVKLIDGNGNAFTILGMAQRAMKTAGWPRDAIKEFLNEAMEGDYDHLLRTVMKYCDVE